MQLVGNALNATERGGVMIRMSLEENAAAPPSGTRPLSIEVADTSPDGPEIHRQVLDGGAGRRPTR